MAQRPGIFLDRDGTVIHDTGYIGDPELVQFMPAVLPALRHFQQAGYQLVVVSNQSGIGRGVITQQQYELVAQRIAELLREHDISTATYYCPHSPDERCRCRKPNPYLLLRAARDLDIDLTRSYMIGDRLTDVEAGAAAGCKTILLGHIAFHERSSLGAAPDYVCPDWSCISQVIAPELAIRTD
ncbi:MAG: D-glycero-alpha-D-manno-heptose-1,7-bisphosphate 7-phosphatase [Bryobacteraceae bacterium]